MEKTKKNQGLIYSMEFDLQNKHCIDKICKISLIHNTGHVKLYTRKGREIGLKKALLIKELRFEQLEQIIRKGRNLFENELSIIYCSKTRQKECESILDQADLLFIRRGKDFMGNDEIIVQVNKLETSELLPEVN